jgi:hypothetical protein
MLASVFREPALVEDCFAGCEAQQQQTAFAKRKWQDAMFRVKTARFGVRGASPRWVAWQDAVRSTSKLRLPRKNDTMSCFS